MNAKVAKNHLHDYLQLEIMKEFILGKNLINVNVAKNISLTAALGAGMKEFTKEKPKKFETCSKFLVNHRN